VNSTANGRGRPSRLLPLVAALLVGCATVPPSRAPGPPRDRPLTPTACEKRALMTGQAPDPAALETVTEGLRWGVLAPESCPTEGGRLRD